jgi:phosphoserine phosphatase RsbU/P
LTAPDAHRLDAASLDQLLEVTRKLAAPFELLPMLAAVAAAARQMLHAERCSVWLHDAATHEVVLEIATDVPAVRLPVGTGLVGLCARDLRPINVPDCYADPRFDPSIDRQSGFHTRCSLTLPLLDHDGALVGVMQMLNREGGVFDAADERLAQALAAQCAVALQRTRAAHAMLQGEMMRQELEVARTVQTSTLPAHMPVVPGYDCHGLSRPATLTGGDTFDLALNGAELLVVLGDATGHGIGPALSVTQMHAMLRMALRLGTPLETAFLQLNNLLAETQAEDRFITAFIGLLDPASHRLRYVNAGQGPVFQLHAADGRWTEHRPTSFPLGAMPLPSAPPGGVLHMAPGDLLVLLSDGIYEYANAEGELFGVSRVQALLAAHRGDSAAAMSMALLDAVEGFAAGAPQEDDITVVLVRREPPASAEGSFPRRVDALDDIFAFTAAFWALHGLDAGLRLPVDFVLEELFTNIVKYGSGAAAPVGVALSLVPGGVQVVIDEPEARPFDPTLAPDADTSLDAEQRVPGGLGLHLIRRMVDAIEYRYTDDDHRGRVTFRKTGATVPTVPEGPIRGGSNAGH